MTTKEQEILAGLYKIRDNLTSYTDYERLWAELTELVPEVPIIRYQFKNTPGEFQQGPYAPNWIYRAMPVKSGGKRWDREGEISYLPKDLLHLSTSFGRGHKPGDRAFYGSLNPYSACTETYTSGSNYERVVKQGETMECVVGVWKTIKPICFGLLPYAEESVLKFFNDDRIKVLNLHKVKPEHVIKEAARNKDMIKNEFKIKVLEFFSEAFALQGNEQFKLSAFYANSLLGIAAPNQRFADSAGNPVQCFEGILYNAVPSSYQERNVLMLPDIVDEKLQFSHAMLFTITHGRDGHTTFNPVQQKIFPKDGVLPWRP